VCVRARCITVRVEDLESAIYIAGVPPCVVLCLHFHLDDLLTLYPSEHCGIRRAVFSAGAETPHVCLSVYIHIGIATQASDLERGRSEGFRNTCGRACDSRRPPV